jgi:hypothetical protein
MSASAYGINEGILKQTELYCILIYGTALNKDLPHDHKAIQSTQSEAIYTIIGLLYTVLGVSFKFFILPLFMTTAARRPKSHTTYPSCKDKDNALVNDDC